MKKAKPAAPLRSVSSNSNKRSTQQADAAAASSSRNSPRATGGVKSPRTRTPAHQPQQTHLSLERDLGGGHATPTVPSNKQQQQHKHAAERSTLGHIKGLLSERLLKPTVSSRIKQKGAEGHSISAKELPTPQQQQQPGRKPVTVPQQHTLPLPLQDGGAHSSSGAEPSGGPPVSLTTTTAAAAADGSAADGYATAFSPHSSLQSARMRLGLTAGLQVAEVRDACCACCA